jgi:hypothetical protein
MTTKLALGMSRLEDQLTGQADAETQTDHTVEQFCGDWITTNSASRGIFRIVVSRQGNGLSVHAFGALHPEPYDWGTVPARLFADGASSPKIRGFCAHYDFGFMETDLQGKTEKGVLVIASFNRFKDGSGRPGYFSREFFYRRTVEESVGG